MPGQGAGDGLESTDVGLQGIKRFDGLENVAVVVVTGLIAVAAADENLDEGEEKLNVLRRRLQTERIDSVFPGFSADLEIRAAQQVGQLLVTASKVKNEGAGIVFFQSEREKVVEEGLAAAGTSGYKRVSDIVAGASGSILNPLVQVKVERSSVNGLNHGQGFPVEKRIPTVALVQAKQERPVGVVVVGYVKLAEIEVRVSGTGR